MTVWCVDADRLDPVQGDDKLKVTRERCFVEASTISAAAALCPEDDSYHITSIQAVGNVIAREKQGD